MGNNLRKQRNKLNLTQVEVARRAKTPYRSYQDYETGRCVPNVYTAIKLASILKTTVEELFS